MATKKEKVLVIDSSKYQDQATNNLVIYLDEPIENVEGIRVIYAAFPCTFYNISMAYKNSVFLIHNGTAYKHVVVPDGFYDLKSFNKEFQKQMENIDATAKNAITFDVQESNGKILISFRKNQNKLIKLFVTKDTSGMFGFNLREGESLELPRAQRGNRLENPAVGDKCANFKPFEYFVVHCNLTDDVLLNGKKSDIFFKVPVKKCNFGETSQHYLSGLRARDTQPSFHKFNLKITDENDNLINFNGEAVHYELSIRYAYYG